MTYSNKLSISITIILSLFLSGCSDSLPSCKSKDTKNLVEEIINQQGNYIGSFIELNNINEKAYNKSSEIRLCSAELTTSRGERKITYSIRWSNKESGEFYVQIN